jgi:hypothetical protein
MWLLLCSGGAWWAATALEAELHQAVQGVKEQQPNLRTIQTEVQGTVLKLTGLVHRESDIYRVPQELAGKIRIQGHPFEPQIINLLELDPLPNGWAALVVNTKEVKLIGRVASNMEAARLIESVRSMNQLQDTLQHDELLVDEISLAECDAVQTTLDTIPRLQPNIAHTVSLHVVNLGEPWKSMDLQAAFDPLARELPHMAMSIRETQDQLRRLLRQQLDLAAVEAAKRKEQQRLQQLPPAHLIVAQRGGNVLLLGSLGAVEQKQQFLQALRKQNCEPTDELQVSKQRSPAESLVGLAKSLRPLPELEAGIVRLAFAGDKEWSTLAHRDLDERDPAPQLIEALGSTRPLALLVPDMQKMLHWLHSVDSWEPTPVTEPMGHLWLVQVGSTVLLRGTVPDESCRTQLTAAARLRYTGRELKVDLVTDGNLPPSSSVLTTCNSLPEPTALDTMGTVSFALPGEAWTTQVARELVFTSLGLQHSQLLPASVPPQRIMQDVLETWPIARAHMQLVQRNTHGIPEQLIGPGTK